MTKAEKVINDFISRVLKYTVYTVAVTVALVVGVIIGILKLPKDLWFDKGGRNGS